MPDTWYQDQLTNFVRAYIECALWSSTDDAGVPLDNVKYADTELAEETKARFLADCERFQTDYIRVLNEHDYASGDFSEQQIAHDFWLTRNGHGAGFWDGDYPEALGDALTALAKTYGECDLYIGDDGKIYAM
jgi:hypothetical protein